MSDAIVPSPPTGGALTVADRVKQVMRTLASRLSQDNLSTTDLSQTLGVLQDWKQNIDELAKHARKKLVNLADERGAVISPAGTKRAIVDGWVLEIRPAGQVWDDKKVMALLAGKGLPLDKWMQPTVVYKVDESRLAVLTELGKLTEAEVAACRYQRSYALQPPHLLEPEEEES